MPRSCASKCQHFRGMLIAHALAHLLDLHHTAYGLATWFDQATGSNSLKAWRANLCGAVPTPARRECLCQLCPSVAHWMDHPLYQALAPKPQSREYWFRALACVCHKYGYRFAGRDQVLDRLAHSAPDIDLAIVLMLLHAAPLRMSPQHVRYRRYLGLAMVLACRQAPLSYVKVELHELITSTFRLDLPPPDRSTMWEDNWPQNPAELDEHIRSWNVLINLAVQVKLVHTTAEACRFCKLFLGYHVAERDDLYCAMRVVRDGSGSIFNYPILRRMYTALRRFRLAITQQI
jgi:hypothetical protein